MSDIKNDNYESLSFYEERSIGVASGFDTFPDDGNFYFTYSVGGKITLISEGYDSAAARDNGVASVEKNLPIGKRYKALTNEAGKFYFSLRAGNHKEIAISRPYDTAAERDATIGGLAADYVAGEATEVAAPVVEAVTTPQPLAAVAAEPVVETAPAVEEAAPVVEAAAPAVEEAATTPEPLAAVAAEPVAETAATRTGKRATIAKEEVVAAEPKKERPAVVVDTTAHDDFDCN